MIFTKGFGSINGVISTTSSLITEIEAPCCAACGNDCCGYYQYDGDEGFFSEIKRNAG